MLAEPPHRGEVEEIRGTHRHRQTGVERLRDLDREDRIHAETLEGVVDGEFRLALQRAPDDRDDPLFEHLDIGRRRGPGSPVARRTRLARAGRLDRRLSRGGDLRDRIGGGRFRGELAEDHRLEHPALEIARPPEDARLAEAFLTQHSPPLLDAQVRGVRQATLGVLDLPPAFEQAVGETVEDPGLDRLDQHQESARLQEALDRPERTLETARGVQHVGADDDLEALPLEPLRDAVLLEIEPPELQARQERPQPRLTEAHEAGRHIRIDILDPVAELRQGRGDLERGRARAGAHLEHPDRAVRGIATLQQTADGFPDDRRRQPVEVVHQRGALIDPGDGLDRPLGKEHLGCRQTPRDHVRQGLDTAPGEPAMRREPWMVATECGLDLIQIAQLPDGLGPGHDLGGDQTAVALFEDSALSQETDQQVTEPCIPRRRLEQGAQVGDRQGFARFTQPAPRLKQSEDDQTTDPLDVLEAFAVAGHPRRVECRRGIDGVRDGVDLRGSNRRPGDHGSQPVTAPLERMGRQRRSTPGARRLGSLIVDAFRRIFLQDDVGVGPGKAKGTHARPARNLQAGAVAKPAPGPVVVDDEEGTPGQVDVRVAGREMQVARNLAVTHRQQHLDQPGDARRRLEMADVRLDGAQTTPGLLAPGVGTQGGKSVLQTIDLDGIAQGGSGAVGFDVGDGRGVDPGAPEGLLDEPALGHRIGGGERGGPPAVILRCAQDQGLDRIAVALRRRQGFQQQRGDTLAPHIAIGRGIEGPAASGRADHAGRGGRPRGVRIQDQIHPADDRHLAFARLERDHRAVHGDERAGTGGIDDGAGTVQIQLMRDPARDEGRRRPQ